VVASPAYLAAHGVPRVPDDLTGHTFVRYAYQAGDRLAFRGPDGTPMPVQPQGRLVLDGGPALRRAALAGAGLTVLPSFAVDEDIAAGRLVALLRDHPLPELTLWAVSPPGRWMPARVRAFVDWLAEAFRTPPWQAAEVAPGS
jgi:DNA-binding transcriptional LysR family regulator